MRRIVDLVGMRYTPQHPWAADMMGEDGVLPINSLDLHIHLPTCNRIEVRHVRRDSLREPQEPTMSVWQANVSNLMSLWCVSLQGESGYAAALGVVLASLITGVRIPPQVILLTAGAMVYALCFTWGWV